MQEVVSAASSSRLLLLRSPPTSRRPATAGARVHWNRLARIAMLCVLAALLYLYASAGASLLSTWKEARQDSAQVATLERQHVRARGPARGADEPGDARRRGTPHRDDAAGRADRT